MRSRRLLLTLAACAWAGLALLASHVLLEAIAQRVEARLDACLWGNFDECRQLLVASNHVDRGAGRVMICGPSEAREGFLPQELEDALPGWEVFQSSLSMGVLSDVELVLEYLERGYGRAALPEVLVVALTPRFAADVGARVSPLATTIDNYSPSFGVDPEGDPPRLVARGGLAGVAARLRFRGKQGLRYRNALRAVRAAGLRAALGGGPAPRRLGPPFSHARYQRRVRWSPERVEQGLAQPNNHFRFTAALEFELVGPRISGRLRSLRERARRVGTRLVFVAMPERSEVRALFAPERYASYLSAVTDGLEGEPLLQLRAFLPDDDFFDANHLARSGALALSERLARELAERLE